MIQVTTDFTYPLYDLYKDTGAKYTFDFWFRSLCRKYHWNEGCEYIRPNRSDNTHIMVIKKVLDKILDTYPAVKKKVNSTAVAVKEDVRVTSKFEHKDSDLHASVGSIGKLNQWRLDQITRFKFQENIDYVKIDQFGSDRSGKTKSHFTPKDYFFTKGAAAKIVGHTEAKNEEMIRDHNTVAALAAQNDMAAMTALVIEHWQAQALKNAAQLKEANNALKIQEPKVEYHDKVLASKTGLLITEIAKMDHGMSGKALNKILNELGMIYKRNGTWVLYSKYDGKGLCCYDTFLTDSGVSSQQIRWTQKGRREINSIVKNSQIL